MDREKLFRYLKSPYLSKREMIARFPLGIDPDELWRELLQRRKAQSTPLPLYSCTGTPYWYVVTDRMIAASEKIVEALTENETEFDPYADTVTVLTLEEVFFTSYVEGSQISMQAAMDYLTSGQPPRDIEEQMIANNRNAGVFASESLCRRIDAAFMSEIVCVLTEGMDNADGQFRQTDAVDYAPSNNECFDFPAARLVPGLIDDLSEFLSSREAHPLIKAAVAQGFMLTVRPFPEGNDRLGRVLSNMILLRAGYTFFSDVSLSALIARKGYAYYEAVANTLRKENGGDLTYFIEYFLDLLSRAVDERKLRMQRREEQNLRTETETARLILRPVDESTAVPPSADFSEDAEQDLPTNSEKGADAHNSIIETYDNETESDQDDEMQAPDYARAILELRPYENSTGERTRATAKQLIKYLVSGKHTFTVGDFERDMKLSRKQAENAVTHFRASGMIETCGRVGKSHCCYRVKTDFPPFTPADYSPEILETVKELQESAESEKDKRIARVLISCLPKGAISTADYDNGIHKLAEDMRLLESLHIVEKYRSGFYLINRQASAAPITLSTEQKAILSQLYERFRTGRFTRKEAIVELNRSKTSLSTQLRLFSQMKIVRRTNEYGITYQLLVTPDDHPELFESIASQAPDEPGTISYDGYSYKTRDMIERLAGSKSSPRDKRLGTSLQRCLKKGTLTRSDYDAWGYSKWMWNSDVTLALQIGLIREIADGAYALNQNPVEHIPELMPAQKKTVTEIYEAFGDKTFSVEMFVATLNHTESYTYASLHHLMLLRILDYKKTADGSVYQLAVNPEDHPECFYTAA